MKEAGARLEANRAWAEAVAEELARLGVRCVVACPGSRNSALVLACARHPKLLTPAHVDERGAGFFALGWARQSGEPAAVLVTSGTAVANLHPAVMEADLAGVPLLILSADRPGELLGLGANQTVDQHRIFGGACRHFRQLPCADDPGMPGFGLSALDEAVFHARSFRGPVHVNLAFREPLVDARWSEAASEAPSPHPGGCGGPSARFNEWKQSGSAWTDYPIAAAGVDGAEAHRRLSAGLHGSRGALLAVGALSSESETAAAGRIARALGLPLYADLLSGLRSEPVARLDAFDRLLSDPSSGAYSAIDTVIHLGGRFLSKPFETWLAKRAPRHLHFHPHGPRVDAALTVREDIACSLEALAACAGSAVKEGGRELWPAWTLDDRAAWEAGAAFLARDRALDELHLPGVLCETLPEGALLFAGNSMPVRDLSAWGATFPRGVRILANRGASGIDGLLATAAGAAFAAQKPAVALLGDLSFLHDLSSLSLPQSLREAFVILVVNNGGGGIFHFLPVAEAGAGFESHIALGHRREFQAAASLFGLGYHRPKTRAELSAILAGSFARKEKAIVEIRTDRAQNAQTHRDLDAAIRLALGALPGPGGA
ncbi:MAG: 2-succinyl-5-enolpyruvyl-6-hydroxy-3-cyclohexene-1-carboxylic-acid synthase [Spirochaetes bacterium]|nr:2-succinyl-5-enolpyruvyl-6-hydroxy-3-cyclohexene-1-carboxylic-acid synthase [Spirochaetota bacterium]